MSQTQGSTVSKENPLVVQARIYAKLLNPPKPARTVVRSDRETVGQSDSRTVTPSPHPKIEAIPQKASVHFKVLATSVFAKEPEKSMALVSEPGKGPSWIKPGDMLGYLKVTEIRRDAVVYAFEETTGEVAWEPSQDTARPRTKVESPILAMEMPSAAASQAPLPSVPSPPLPSRLATPVNGRMHAISPRPARGGR
ncbi:MAG: hypothetical protein K9N55_06100 [Phycisphaerae bacterium]|nr:hypothetical protein [Phycisphaerae bacterium]